jgi:hypothetical protein
MNKLMNALSVSALLLGMVSCGGNENGPEKQDEQVAKPGAGKEDTCVYSLDEKKGLEIRWIAYKHTAKVPVEGTFVDYEIISENAQGSLKEVLENLEVQVSATKVSTQDDSRAAKIVQFFFQIFKSPEYISGKIESFNGSDKMGDGTMNFTMNETSYSVPFDYVVRESGEIVITCTIDVNNWNGQAAVASLNAACEEKHTGDDGQSILWSEVKVVISGYLKKKC